MLLLYIYKAYVFLVKVIFLKWGKQVFLLRKQPEYKRKNNENDLCNCLSPKNMKISFDTQKKYFSRYHRY